MDSSVRLADPAFDAGTLEGNAEILSYPQKFRHRVSLVFNRRERKEGKESPQKRE